MTWNWRDFPMVGFDLETTGIDPEADRVVTACVGAAGASRPWAATNWLLRQTQPIPEAATAIHGITTEQANEHGMSTQLALTQIRDSLYEAWADWSIVCGFNIAYDMTLLDRDLRRHGLTGFEVRGPILDGYVIDKQIDPYRKGSRKLVDVCTHYGITLNEADAHGAEADALAATRLAWKLASHPDLTASSWQALNGWQKAAYHQQRASFAGYLHRQGKHAEAAEVAERTVWPLEPMQQAVAA